MTEAEFSELNTGEIRVTAPLFRGVGSYPGAVWLVASLVVLLCFAAWIYIFQYHDAFAESDIYRVLIGILDGEVSGTGIHSNLHYDSTFGFGYLAAFYALASPQTLFSADKLTSLINNVGFWSMLAGLLCFWSYVAISYGIRNATVALVMFAFCPMLLELGTSGHPVIPMFALLFAGATLLSVPVTGRQAVFTTLGGSILLLAGLLTRGEIVLAFPWLVLSCVNATSCRAFITSCLHRVIAPVAAIVAFLILQRFLVAPGQTESQINEYFGHWFSFSHIVLGLLYAAFGFGIATALLAGVATLGLSWKAIKGRIEITQLLGPAALGIVPLAFFIPNPQPTRHFILAYAGFSILIAIWLTSYLNPRRGVVMALGLVILVATNQVLAEAARLPVLAKNDTNSPYRPVWDKVGIPYLTATHAPLGFEWKRHAALEKRFSLWRQEGNMLAAPCQPFTLVLTEETAQLFSRLYAQPNAASIKATRIGADDVISYVSNKSVFYRQEKALWPRDPVSVILSDPDYRDFKIYQDAYTMSEYDHTPIPADRQAKFGCH